MNAPLAAPEDTAKHGLPFREFVAMMAAIIAVNALGIDIMLPGLGLISRELNVTIENHQQLVIAVYITGFGVGQLLWGPISDRFGRRQVLLGSLIAYAVTSFIAALAGSFELLLAARLLQGLSSASTRVLTVSIVRDCYSGRRMARVASLAFMIFLAVPILAPSLGQMILLIAPWRWIFYLLGAYSLTVAFWAWKRLPETLDPANRRPIHLGSITASARSVLVHRQSLGYTMAQGFIYGGLLGFLNSSQQILSHVFHRPELFAMCFGLIAGFMGLATLLNARFVERFGMRVLSHAALVALIAIGVVRLGVVLTGQETLPSFILLQGLSFFCYGLAGSNFGALAMDPMGHIAGTAASVQGFLSTIIGTGVGLVIGQSFSGTTLPLTLGWEINALVALAIVLTVERGRLFGR
jgi:MFS transporter, DHA1 family, multidrug resistance protein